MLLSKEKMIGDKRREIRKKYSGEIGFESMLAEKSEGTVVFRNGRGADISHGGLGLTGLYRATEGEIVKLSIPFNGLDITVPVFAEVMWVVPFDESYRVGLRFLK